MQTIKMDSLDAHRDATELALDGATDANISKLAGCARLQNLSLRLSYVTDAGLATLAGLGLKLTALKLGSGHGITSTGIRALTRLETLERLSASSCNDLTHATSLAELPRLKELDLEGCRIGDDTLTALARAPALVSLNVSRTRATSAGLQALAASTTLEQLNALSLRLDAAALEQLGRMVALKKLTASWLCADPLLSQLQSVEELVLGDVHELEEGVEWNKSKPPAALVVRGMPKLVRLDLRQTGVKDVTLEDLPSLTSLDLTTSKTRKLRIASCAALTTLDLGPQGYLTTLELEGLPALARLEVGKCLKLTKALFGELPALTAKSLPAGVVPSAPKPTKKKRG